MISKTYPIMILLQRCQFSVKTLSTLLKCLSFWHWRGRGSIGFIIWTGYFITLQRRFVNWMFRLDPFRARFGWVLDNPGGKTTGAALIWRRGYCKEKNQMLSLVRKFANRCRNVSKLLSCLHSWPCYWLWAVLWSKSINFRKVLSKSYKDGFKANELKS